MNSFLLCLSAALGPGQPALPPPTPMYESPPPLVMPAPARHPISICEFAAAFHPAPGKYEVLFIHPVKKCPVLVCFTLPPGCPKVCVGKRSLTFDYGSCCVSIQFKLLCGRVKVVYS